MPELPEVETVCQALKPVLEGQSFLSIQLNRSNLRYPFPANLNGILATYPIIGVRRRAKYLLIEFKHNLTLIWHLGMSGRVIIENVDAPFLKSSPHDHVIFTTCHDYRITYRDPRRFGFLLLSPTEDLETLRPFNTLGPEPFDNSKINGSIFYNRIKSKSASIKSTLLDQTVIAGIGNIYASEALWQARLSPLRPANTLTLDDADILLKEIQNVLKRAIAAGGSTLRDHFHPNGDKGYFQHQFKVYDQEDILCSHCRLFPILKLMQNGRSTYYCNYCQK